MIHLLTYPAMFGQFAASPFCTKAALLLTLSGQAWQREDMLDPRKMPYGKLPAIRAEGKIIADSDNIRAYLKQNGTDFDAGLSDIDRSTARAFIRMAEEHIYFHLLLDRWGNDAVWPSIRDTYFVGIPGVMRGFIAGRLRREVLRGMHAQGLGRFTAEERLARLEPDLRAIRTRLAQTPYLFGEHATAADCSMGPMLGAAIATPVPTALSKRVAEDKLLADYAARVSALLD
jgi:glutathione S-transferase